MFTPMQVYAELDFSMLHVFVYKVWHFRISSDKMPFKQFFYDIQQLQNRSPCVRQHHKQKRPPLMW